MGEMADMYADMAASLPDWMTDGDDYPTGHGPNNRFDDFRTDCWEMKNGKQVIIKDMSDHHLLAAYKMFGDERFRDEMIIRLFETMIQPKIGF